MTGYLIGEEGPLETTILRLENGKQWVIGRDADEVDIVLEDLMVSRRHVVCQLTTEGFIMENLSSVNPATQNGRVITEPVLLQEGDILQIGSTFFRFTEKLPTPATEEMPTLDPLLLEDATDLSQASINSPSQMRWMIKVITGPNTGAEFSLQKRENYIIGKDPLTCDIILQDLSVSRQHARINVDENDEVFIEDLESRNGTLIKGKPITQKHLLGAQDVVTLGTSSILIIDRGQLSETVISDPPKFSEESITTDENTLPKGDWKKMLIKKKHLAGVGLVFSLFLVLCIGGISLFRSEPVVIAKPHDHELAQIVKIMEQYPSLRFTYNEGSGKLFLAGHILTAVDKKELDYKLHSLTFLQNIENNIVIDELVWTNINAMLAIKPAWSGISISASIPGEFVLRGYIETLEEAQLASEYLNMYFPYMNNLSNQVIVESNLYKQVQEILLENSFNEVIFQLVDGELVLSGRVNIKQKSLWLATVEKLEGIPGIRLVKNYISLLKENTSFVDLTDKYTVTGCSKKDGVNDFVVIDGKILTVGDVLDEEMVITKISPKEIVLEKSGLKFKINCNLK
jgi:type III secretion system YscD/HrpQ family protein